jgi:hypothetical protein
MFILNINSCYIPDYSCSNAISQKVTPIHRLGPLHEHLVVGLQQLHRFNDVISVLPSNKHFQSHFQLFFPSFLFKLPWQLQMIHSFCIWLPFYRSKEYNTFFTTLCTERTSDPLSARGSRDIRPFHQNFAFQLINQNEKLL